ncbi:MAG: hypothetical protein KatS3mg003_1299 [Candidatus Nitrosocaldaceae archaeon]|nr:MAG: hypothetical protein KatS3mg003_1299 [Candidatus Nitrosocaldaceae archaeon]
MVHAKLLTKFGIRKASRLSGYATSSYYYKHKDRADKRLDKRLDLELLEKIEQIALDHPSYGIRRITAILNREGIKINRKKVYRLLKILNLIKRNSIRNKIIRKRVITVATKPNQLWEQDITYI